MSENQEILSCRLTETERIERAKAMTDDEVERYVQMRLVD